MPTITQDLTTRQALATDGSNYVPTAGEWKYAVVDEADGDTVVYAGPCLVKGVSVIETFSAHVMTLDDDTQAVLNIPASTAAGVVVDLDGVRFDSNLTVNVDASATAGIICVFYRPLATEVIW